MTVMVKMIIMVIIVKYDTTTLKNHDFCQDATKIKMQRGSRYNEDQNATRIKMQQEISCNKDAMRIKSRCKEDKYAMRIKMQRGSKCNEDQGPFSHPFSVFQLNQKEGRGDFPLIS